MEQNLSSYFGQIKKLTYANMRSRYRRTVAGLLWVILNPIIMYSVQAFVFKKFLKLELPNYSLFLLGGLLPWIFITSTMDMCTPMLHTSAELLKSFRVPPFVLIYAQVLDNFFNFLLTFLLILVPLYIFYMPAASFGVFFLPLAIIIICIGVLGIVTILSLLHVFFKDTKFVVQFSTSILFFLTPIFYPMSYVPEKYRWVIDINPIYALINPFRICIYQFDVQLFFAALAKGFIVAIIFGMLGLMFWRKKRNEFYLAL